MATNIGTEQACKTQRLMVLLLLCAVPATVQLCRHVHSVTPGMVISPQRVVYELRGDVKRPGISRHADEQTTEALAQACGAYQLPQNASQEVPSGTRMNFTTAGVQLSDMDAPALLSFGLPISLATASADDLELIPGIGPKTARALIEYRDRTGPIQRIGQIIDVRGIGPKTLEKIAPYIRP